MPLRRGARHLALGLALLCTVGCGGGAPPDGARALVPADHLEQQRLKLVQWKASLKAQPAVRHGARR
jgi:hypothetical protein